MKTALHLFFLGKKENKKTGIDERIHRQAATAQQHITSDKAI